MLKLVDTHIHFWDTNRLRYPWLDDMDAINDAHLPAELPPSGDDWRMEKLVFVQAGCLPEQGLDEAAWVTELAGEDQRISGIVAYAPLDNHNFRAYMVRLGANPLVKGVRRLIQSEGDGFARQPHFIEAVNELNDYGYTFDICVFHHQLPDVLELVAGAPDTPFVLDHLGKPPIAEGLIDEWAANIRKLAAYDHVHCKVSGMVTEADTENWTRDDLQPYVDTVLEAFGPARLMYGGDYPLMKLAGMDYAGWLSTARTLLNTLSDDERERVFYQNAIDFYDL